MESIAASAEAKIKLSPRELQVLTGLAADRSMKELAIELGISIKTARAYLSRAKRKLRVRSAGAAIAEAVRRGGV